MGNLPYPLYLTIDNPIWREGNYSSNTAITGTIYSDEAKTQAVDLTGWTLILRMYRPLTDIDFFGKTATVNADQVGNKGKFSYNPKQGELPPPNIYWISADLEKTGEVLNTVEEEFIVHYGAAGSA